MNNSNILQELSKPLNIEDVDFRIQSINKAGYATILAYKDARVDMNRLDEVCGAKWQKEYKYIESEKMLFCRIGIQIENEWIWREDLGTESFSEAKKGQASDAFKRACFNWGIGRELYDYPFIQVKLKSNEFRLDNNGKAKQTWDLKLKEWVWNVEFKDGKVISLTAKDEKGADRYNSGKTIIPKNTNNSPTVTPAPAPAQTTTNQNTSNTEKKWLNITDSNRSITAEWQNVAKGIDNGTVTSVDDIRKHYKVSKAVEAKITELLNYKPA